MTTDKIRKKTEEQGPESDMMKKGKKKSIKFGSTFLADRFGAQTRALFSNGMASARHLPFAWLFKAKT